LKTLNAIISKDFFLRYATFPVNKPYATLWVPFKIVTCSSILQLNEKAQRRIFYDPLAALEHGSIHYPEHEELCHIPEDLYSSGKKDFKELLLEGEMLLAGELTVTVAQQKAGRRERELFSSLILGSVLQCEFCEYIFADIAELLVHSASHVAERRFECTVCNMQMNTAKEASTHFQTDCIFMREAIRSLSVTLSRHFVCNVCELKFANTDLLQEHR